jgi:glycosyltransferase involved in cell wall biosynthesis
MLVEPDGEAVAAALGDLLRDDDQREHLRDRGLRRARTCTWERTVAELDGLLSAVAARRRSA